MSQSRADRLRAAVSYDLYMLSLEPGRDPMETLEHVEEREPPDAVVAERNRRIADALMATNANYMESELRIDVIAEQAGISVEQARAKHRDDPGSRAVLGRHAPKRDEAMHPRG